MILFYQQSHARKVSAQCSSQNSEIKVLFHRSQFDWPERILSLRLAYSHNHAELFSTDRTLTDALRLRESHAATRRPRGSDSRGRALFARCSPSLFH